MIKRFKPKKELKLKKIIAKIKFVCLPIVKFNEIVNLLKKNTYKF